MKNRLLMGAAALALLGTLGHFGAKPLLAQIRAALVKNIDERGRSPYMVQTECHSAGQVIAFCQASFPVVPANKRFVVEYVSGYLQAAHGKFGGGFLQVPSAGVFNFPLQSHFEATDTLNQDAYSVSMPAVFYYEPGQTPVFFIDATVPTNDLQGNVTLSGYLVDLAQ